MQNDEEKASVKVYGVPSRTAGSSVFPVFGRRVEQKRVECYHMLARKEKTLEVFLVQAVKVWMLDRVLGGDTVLGAVSKELFQEIHADWIELGCDVASVWDLSPDRKGWVPVGQSFNARPDSAVGSSELSKDLEDLIDFGISRKERSLGDHFDKDGSNGPDIDRRSVGLASQENLRWTVPQGDDFVGQRTNGRAKGTGETEIRQLEASLVGDEEVLWLQVTVHDAPRVAKGKTFTALVEETLDLLRRQQPFHGFHVLFQVLVEELKDEEEFSILLHTVSELDDVGVAQLSQQTNLTESSGRNPFVLHFQTDAFQGDNLVVAVLVLGLVDDPVRSLSQRRVWLFNLLVSVA